MKRIWMLILLAMLSAPLVACKPTTNGEMQTETPANGKIDRSNVLSDLTSATAELQSYYLQYNKYPDKLTDLKIKLYHPNDLVYDAKKGQVRSKSFPDL